MLSLFVLALWRSNERVPVPTADNVFEVPGWPTDSRVLFGKLREVLGDAQVASPSAAANGLGYFFSDVAIK